jgi:hypothetical protein
MAPRELDYWMEGLGAELMEDSAIFWDRRAFDPVAGALGHRAMILRSEIDTARTSVPSSGHSSSYLCQQDSVLPLKTGARRNNPLFHLPDDRWPEAINTEVVSRVAAAAAALVVKLTR